MSIEDKKKTQTTIARLVETTAGRAVNDIKTDTAESVEKNSEVVSFEKGENKAKILERLLHENMLVEGSSLSRDIQDDYRRIKRPLVSNACGRNKSMVNRGNLILVTSSIPDEGKTYTSINLALSISQEMDTTVLLVDCDVAKQGVSRMLGLEKLRGLVDVLECDDLTISDVLLQTDVPNLRVMPAGKQHEYVAELLASQRMDDLINEMATRYKDRIIIIDGPPLLPTPLTQILARLVGQVVFVIEAGKTPQSLVEEALEMIPEEQAIGLVLNKNEGLSSRGNYYGYYSSEDDVSVNDKKR